MFRAGERYILTADETRSDKSQRFYHAAVNELFKNLPEGLAVQFPTSEHFRKRALIETGWKTERQFVAASKAEALRLATFLRGSDEFAAIAVNGAVIIEWRAVSQKVHAMGKANFETSKQDVLAWGCELVGVPLKTLSEQARLRAKPAPRSLIEREGLDGEPQSLPSPSKPADVPSTSAGGRPEPGEGL